MATKTVVSNVELSSMPANSIKANPTNSSSQPYDMVVNSNQIVANFSGGLGSIAIADNQVVCNPSGAGVGLTALNIGENQVFCNPSGTVGLTGLKIPVNTVLGNAANGLNAITLQGINGIETTTSGNTIRIDGSFLSNAVTTGYTASLNSNGYQKLPSGLIMQWGYSSIPGSTSLTVTLPISFPNACLNVSVSKHATSGSVLTDGELPCVSTPSKTTIVFDNSLGTHTTPIYWFAVGY